MALAAGDYIARKEPVLFLGDCGTGKTHLATGLCVAACRQLRKVRFVSTAGLMNELLERLHRLDGGVPYGIALAAAALLVYPHTEWMHAAGL